MPAKHEIERPEHGGRAKRRERVRQPIALRLELPHARRQRCAVAVAKPRHHDDPVGTGNFRQGRDEIAIILGDAARAAECIGDQRQRIHRFDTTFKAAPPDRPSAAPMGNSAAAAAAPACQPRMRSSSFSQRSIGVENPVLARVTTWSGTAALGAAASRRLPAAGGSAAKSVATACRRLASTNGTRTSSECAMLAQSVSRKSWLRR